jgi:hypothetical protein
MPDHLATRVVSSQEAVAASEQRLRPWDLIKGFVRSEGALMFRALTTALFYLFSDALTHHLAPDLKTMEQAKRHQMHNVSAAASGASPILLRVKGSQPSDSPRLRQTELGGGDCRNSSLSASA